MLSDTVSLNGLSRTPYIALAGGIGAVSLLCLAAITMTVVPAVLFMFNVNLSVASPDVMIDAVVTENCKKHPAFASDLQSLCWGSFAVFSVLGFRTSGLMIHNVGPRGTFAVLIITSALVFLAAFRGYLGEAKKPHLLLKKMLCYFEANLQTFREHKKLFYLAIFVSFCALSLSITVMATTIWAVRVVVVLTVATAVSSSVYFSNRVSFPDVANVALFIFLRECLTPDLETVMFYW